MTEAFRTSGDPVPLPARATALLVLGMHRSGTSALTRLLNLLGADLPGRLMPPVPGNNDRGFWESETIKALHEQLLRELGASWHSVTGLDDDRLRSGVAEPYRARLRDALERDFARSRLFVLKDPRACRLLPLWLPVLTEFGAEPTAVIALRNPLEVAASLQARDGFSTPKSLLLWLRHMLEAEAHTRELRRCVVGFEELLTDWRATAGRIAAQLDLDWPCEPDRAAADIDAFLSPRQRHHAIPDRVLAERPDLAEWVTTAYAALQDLSRHPASRSARQQLDAIAHALRSADRTFGSVLDDTDRALSRTRATLAQAERDRQTAETRLQARQAEVDRLDELARRQEQQLRIAQETLERRRDRLEQQQTRLEQQQQRIAELERVAEQRAMRLVLAETRVRRLADELSAVQGSRSWRWTAPLRGLGESRSAAGLALSLLLRERARIPWRYLQAYRLLADSGLFMVDYYRDRYPDVGASGRDPLWHYLCHGSAEGRQPNPLFDTEWYRNRYPDIADSGLDPLVHYLRYGASEGRDPGPGFDTGWYLGRYPDVARSGANPLAHYLQHGESEGRLPRPEWNPVIGAGPAEAPDGWPPALPASIGVQRVPGRAAPVDPAARAVPGRVLVVGHACRAPLFGAERSLLDVIRALHRHGREVHAVFPHHNPDYFAEMRDQVRDVSVFEYRWWREEQALDEQVVIRFMRLIRELDIELVHVNTIMLREPLEAARRMGVPSVVHVREIISHDPYLSEHIGLDCRHILEQVNRRADYLIANSDAALHGFDREGTGFKVYNGVDIDRLDLANPVDPATIRVGLISSNIPKKGLLDFVHLARLAEAELPRLRFVLIGPLNRHIERLAESAGIEALPGNLEIAGYADEPRAALEQVNIVVNLSNFAESFGRSVAEAMAARRPVIVYDHGALPELVRPGIDGYVIPYRHYAQALEPLRELCEQPERIAEMGERARARAVERFSLEAMEVALEQAYQGMRSAVEARAAASGPLRIGYFMWHFPVPGETFVLNELRWLVERGFDVEVFCRHSPHPEFVPDFAIRWRTVATPEALSEALRESERTLVHAHFTYPTVTEFVWPACERLGLDFTFIAHAQDIFRYENERRNRIAEIARSPFCRRIFVLGRFHHDYLVERGVPAAKLMINPQLSDALQLAASPAARRIGTRFDRRRICAIQRLVEKKGLVHLIDAAPGLAQLGVTVDIYGYGPLEEDLAERIERLGADNVRLCGAIGSREQLLDVFAEYDLLISPSVRAADGDMDGIPTVLMEAMGTGLPVLSSRIASVPDLIRDGVDGLLCEPGGAAAIVAAVERFYRMPAGRVRALAENAATRVRTRYRPDRIMANLLRHWRRETVDLIIVSWNNLPELREVIARIFRYTTLPFRLIVCDNASESDVVDYLETLARQHANVTVIHKGYNSYVGPGTNTALEAGRSKYAIYLCGKEGFVVNHGWEVAMIDYMEEHPQVGLAGSLGYSPSYLTGRQYIDHHPLFAQFRNPEFAAEHPDRVFRHVQGGLFIIRRAMFEEIGGFSEAVPHAHTDTEYNYYVESRGWRLGTVPEILALYNKTRPGLLSRLDENVLAMHPPTLAMTGLLDQVAAGKARLCNLCGWQGEAFAGEEGEETCPQCGSQPFQRSVYRYLAESLLTYRGLKGLYVDPHPALEPFWREQFGDRVLSAEQFHRAVAGQPFDEPETGLDVILCGADLPDDPTCIAALGRLLKPDGVLLLRAPLDTVGEPLPDPSDRLAMVGMRIGQRMRYASEVVRFDWQALLVCRKRVE